MVWGKACKPKDVAVPKGRCEGFFVRKLRVTSGWLLKLLRV